MLHIAVTSFWQILSPRFRPILLKVIGLTLALLIVAGLAFSALAAWLLDGFDPWIAMSATFAAGLAYIFVAAYLLAPISSVVAGFFLDEVAERVESDDYPADAPGVALPIMQALVMSGRFALLIGAVNLGALLLLLIPGVNMLVFFVANAYLLGREYFELAACRFHGVAGARALRRRHGVTVFLHGLLIAFLLAVPVVNLLTPLFGTVLMVHLQKRLARGQVAEGAAN